MNEFELVAVQLKKIVAMGDHYLEELNNELKDCNITVTYKSARNLDYDNPENTTGDKNND